MYDYITLSAAEAQKLIRSEPVIVLDVRDHRSYRAGHIEGARLFHEGLERLLLDEGDYDKPLLFYCYRGVESKKKADYFANRGFKRVYSLENGYTGWPRESAVAPRQF